MYKRLRLILSWTVEVLFPRHLDWRPHIVGRRHPLGAGYVMRRWRNGEWQYRRETEDEMFDRIDATITW